MRVRVRGPHPLRPGIQPGSPGTWFYATDGRPVGAGKRDPSTPRAQPPTGITRARFGLIRFRSPLLTEYPFLQVLRCFTSLRTPRTRVPAHDGRWVPPFGNLGSKPCWRLPEDIAASNVLHRSCLPRHPPTPLQATRTTRCAWPQGSFLANSQTTNHHTKMITKRSKQTLKIEFDSKSTARTRNQKKKPRLARVHYPVLKPPRTTTPSGRDQPAIRHDGHRIAPGRSLGWRSGSPKAHPHHSRGTSHDGRTESP
ncbi:Uncharacterised protein [Bifidobacterium bifidum]|nr:Uncharacterised protein [Bifidobacterium bifidum]